MVLYRKYRPQKFADLVGQEEIVKTLLAQLSSGKIAHGYLFAGPRGTGKTSTARILAKAVNCEVYRSSEIVHRGKLPINDQRSTINVYGEPCNKCAACKAITDGSYLDLIEIDAASNRGIDEIRDLREKIRLSPVAGRFKVYIIDEVHMLTTEAFNALLKTLEEPPAHAIFILATTEQHKLPKTILSRLSRFNFKRAKTADIAEAVNIIAKKEKIKLEEDAEMAIARVADGSFRDALTLLDQLWASDKEITKQDVQSIAKVGGDNLTLEFINLLFARELVPLVKLLDEIAGSVDLSSFNRELIFSLEKILKFKIGAITDEGLGDFEENKEVIAKAAFEDLTSLLKMLLVLEGDMKLYPLPETSILLAVCKWCGEQEVKELKEVKHVVEEKKEEEPKVKVSKSGSSAVTLAQVEENWGDFLNRVRPINAHVVALLKSTRPTEIVGDTLILEVFFRFHKDKLGERKILDSLCSILTEVMGTPLNIQLKLAERLTRPTVAVVKSDVVEIPGEDLTKIAEEIFLK